MRLGLAALLVVLALPATAAAATPQAGIVRPRTEQGMSRLELGYQLYAGNCASCHGTAGLGVQPSLSAEGSGEVSAAGPSLRGKGALAADFYLRTGYMPLAHPGQQPRRSKVLFSPNELDALVAYVASLGTGPKVPAPEPDRGSVSAGLTLFTEHCAGCHQVAARGGYLTGAVAPPLASASRTQIAEAVRVGPYLMPRFSTRAISDHELDSIVAYVEYAKRPQNPGGWSIGRLGPVPEGLVAWFIAGAALVGCCLVIGARARR
jgi:quinol---cytochrome-c reductase cytochrome c subunit